MTQKDYRKKEDYVYGSTRVRIFEKRLLSKAEMNRFLQAGSWEEGLAILKASPYGNRMDAQEESFIGTLQAEKARLLSELEEAIPGSSLLRLISLPDLYHDLKVLVKIELLGQDLSYLLVDVPEVNLQELATYLARPEENPRQTDLQKTLALVCQDFAQHQDPERTEIILDKALCEAMLTWAKQSESDMIVDWVVEQIDFENLDIFLRMHHVGRDPQWFDFAFIPGGRLPRAKLQAAYAKALLPQEEDLAAWGVPKTLVKAWQQVLDTRDIGAIEKAQDEASIAWAMKASRKTYGPEIPFAYYLRRQTEILNLQILMVALQSNLEQAEKLRLVRTIPA